MLQDNYNYKERILVSIKILMFEDYERVVQSDSLSIMVCGLFDYLKTKFNDGVHSSERELTIVSDTIFMSYDAASKDNVILALSDIYVIQRMLLVFGFISEGIATMGKVVHQGGILYGPGYAKAKEMMQTLEYPVVLVDDTIFDYVENAPVEGDLENVYAYLNCLEKENFGVFVPFQYDEDLSNEEILTRAGVFLEKGPNAFFEHLSFKYAWLRKHLSDF